ncbi:hypothetical protein [Klebsiella quasipneumoniae]|uniref:hypothetical protein n=1 Tax=Klebsiella quasipneumoniae TaxID=1463165 RepID=UPI001F187B63|nr:hypothetical protein [Klebsiella quasipneumoniae]
MVVNQQLQKNSCETFTIWGLMGLSVLGATYISKLLPVSETGLLEVIFLLSSVITFFCNGVNKGILIVSVLSLLYLVYSFFSVLLITHANLIDFTQAYKSFYYFFLLAFFYNKKIFRETSIIKLFNFLMAIFLFKYSADRFLFGIDRPTVLIENNFELILLILLYYFVNIIKKEQSMLNTFLMLLICIISGSRSSLIALMVAIVFSLDRKIDFKKIIIITLLPLAVLGVFLVFQARLDASGGSSYEQIDRYRFFLEFVFSTSHWPWWEFLTGSTAITPLSPLSCAHLSFYQPLFSYSGDGRCYSVILHSFLLRVIYDHGVIGFAFLIACLVIFLNKFALKHKICIITILLATAMSVSSLNNVYVTLALVFFIGAEKNYRMNT